MCILKKMESWRGSKGQAFGSYLHLISKSQEDLLQLESLTTFLSDFYESISFQQRFYHVWFNSFDVEKCPYCGNTKKFNKNNKFSIDRYGESPTNSVNYYGTCMSPECRKKFNLERTEKSLIDKYGTANIMEIPGMMDRIKKSNRDRFGCDFYTETEDFKNKTKETFLKKYGKHPTKLESTQEKKRKTNLERYGYEHVLNNPEFKEKSKKTNRDKYGGNSSMCSDVIKNKSKETSLRKHGVEWYVQSEDFKRKFKETMLSKYGVEQVMHYAPSFEKSVSTSYKKKIYVFPSGRIEKIQGYEGFAINDLLNSGYAEDDIVVSNRDIEKYTGDVWYYDRYDDKNKKYYPDLYIVSENKIIEVKCEYTYNSGYSRNILKKQACLEMGLFFEFWVYDKDGNKHLK